ncbi:hypothetical protein EMCG_01829 [[Emmonsia] crescens]|uniref:Uncharacterized protein n=1 Tax=[Emmonsia] crescens TaxID=73230 RepID=A0A0G2J9F2_9EURO|nr:hypothetical protein EMCG_01829 [Emmonsia crescens UAMH 3008]
MTSSATAITSSTPHLSFNDSAVLQALFDAESSPSNTSAGIHLDSSLPQQLPGISPAELSRLQAQELDAISPLQQPQLQENTVKYAEAIRTAVSKLTVIIDGNRQYASAYVNRAQALRMLVESNKKNNNDSKEGLNRDREEEEEEEEEKLADLIFSDLSTAITLLTPSSSSSSPPSTTISISALHSRILENAHTHRAYILYRAARSSVTSTSTPTPTSTSPLPLPRHLRHKSSQELEEMASMDFQQGGRYGNEIARQMAVKTNPYAKMCGAIVKEAMRKEMRGGCESERESGGFVV